MNPESPEPEPQVPHPTTEELALPGIEMPEATRRRSPKFQRAFWLMARDPGRTGASVAKEVGLYPDSIYRVRASDGWAECFNDHDQRVTAELERLRAKQQLEAVRARDHHLELNVTAAQLLERLLHELVETDADGNVTGLKETVRSFTRDGEPVLGRASPRDVQALVAALAKHWEHSAKIAGVELEERRQVSAQGNKVPPVSINLMAAPESAVRLAGSG